MDERARARIRRKSRRQFRKSFISRTDDDAASVQTRNARRPVECAKHDDNAPVLSQVRDRLCPAARIILVSDLHRSENAERISALGRNIDMPRRRQWRCGHKENGLFRDPIGQIGRDVFESFAHDFARLKYSELLVRATGFAPRKEMQSEERRVQSFCALTSTLRAETRNNSALFTPNFAPLLTPPENESATSLLAGTP